MAIDPSTLRTNSAPVSDNSTPVRQSRTALTITLVIAAVIAAMVIYSYSSANMNYATTPDQSSVSTATPTGEETGSTPTDTAPVTNEHQDR